MVACNYTIILFNYNPDRLPWLSQTDYYIIYECEIAKNIDKYDAMWKKTVCAFSAEYKTT